MASPSRSLVPILALIAASTTPLTARGQADAPPPSRASSPTLLGAGIWSRPAYLGSGDRVLMPIPFIRYYRDPLFVRTTQGLLEGGARVLFADSLSLGAQLAYEPGRKSGDSDFLTSRGIETLPVGASLGLHTAWDTNVGPAPVTLLLRFRRELGADRGAQADARATVGVHGGVRLRLGVFAQATWADAASNQAYYGISGPQAATSGLPVFDADQGLTSTAGGLLWSYDLGARWLMQGALEARQLSSELRRSPLAQVRRGAYVSAGLAFRP